MLYRTPSLLVFVVVLSPSSMHRLLVDSRLDEHPRILTLFSTFLSFNLFIQISLSLFSFPFRYPFRFSSDWRNCINCVCIVCFWNVFNKYKYKINSNNLTLFYHFYQLWIYLYYIFLYFIKKIRTYNNKWFHFIQNFFHLCIIRNGILCNIWIYIYMHLFIFIDYIILW